MLSIAVLLLYGLPKEALVKLGRSLGILAKPDERTYRSVLITGASVGIGAGLAKSYAKEGVQMTLTAYSKGSLDDTVAACRKLGATVVAEYVDVKDTDRMAALVQEADARAPLDIVIANAGVTARIDGLRDSHWVFDTNLKGLLNTVLPAIELMRPRKSGKLVLMSSLGGHSAATNLFMTPYIATKSAIKAYGEGLRASLGPEGVEVTVICPGFVDSRMTREQTAQGVKFYMLWSLEKALKTMLKGIDENRGEVSFPLPLYAVTRVTGNLPSSIRDMALPVLSTGDPYYGYDKKLQAAPDDATRELIASGKFKEE